MKHASEEFAIREEWYLIKTKYVKHSTALVQNIVQMNTEPRGRNTESNNNNSNQLNKTKQLLNFDYREEEFTISW